MKHKAAITFEKEETLVVRQSASHMTDYCPACNLTVPMFTPEVMATITDTSEREIFRLIEGGCLPFVETNRLYACLECYRKCLSPKEYRKPLGE
jgi:hypothetical protein